MSLAVLSGLTLCCVLGWLALGEANVARRGGSVDAPSALRSEPRAAKSSASDAHAAAQPDASAREVVATLGPELTPLSELRILVVEHESQQPLPNARVWIARRDIDAFAWDDAEARYGSRALALMLELGDEFAADERGELRVPLVESRTRIHAAAGDLHGGTVATASDIECVIELRRMTGIEIEVVDGGGSPVPGVWLALLEGEDPSAAWTAMTDDTGRASVLDLDDVRSGASGRWRVGVAFGAAVPDFVDLDERSPSWEDVRRRPIRFVLGDTGAVEFQLVDERGQTLAIDAEFALDVDESRIDAHFTLEENMWHTRLTRNGHVRFEHIALGLPLAIQVWALGFEFDEPADLSGPSLAGETKQVELRCASVRPIARGRVVDPEGRPAAHACLTASRPARDARAPLEHDAVRFACTTDAHGAFEAMLRRDFLVLDERELTLMVSDTNRATHVARIRVPALVANPRAGSPPSYDFGEVVVEPLEVLVSGVVVDDRGAPVECARIEARDATNGRDIGADDSFRCETDEAGHFVVSGDVPSARLAVWAEGDGVSNTVVAERGASDVRLTLRTRGRIVGKLLLPPGVDIDDFHLSFGAAVARAEPWKSPGSSHETFHDGRFITDREPGLWNFAVFEDGRDEPLWRRDGLVVESKQRLDLGEIDLRALLEGSAKSE